MKAATIERFSTPAHVHEIATPELEDNAVVLRVTAAGVNPIDWKNRDGDGEKRAVPLTLGQDFAGVIERVGVRVRRVKAGDRIFGCARDHGSYAEFTTIRDDQHDSPFAIIPPNVSDAQAAAIPTPVLTALAALEATGVQAGTELLIVGGGDSVGSAVIQLARLREARITAFVKAGQEDEARRAGADLAVSTDAAPVPAIRSAHPAPFDVVIDLVSEADALKAEATLLKRDGVILTTIHVADEAWFREHALRAINITLAETPQSSPAALKAMARLVGDGSLVLNVPTERPLDDANAVLDGIKAGEISGKVILRP
jgi:NADPH:quinone reductase-like Zn-dependent oxidoreductase